MPNRSQRHKVEEQGRASSGAIYEQGAINDKVAGALGAIITGAQPHLTSLNPATGVHGTADITVHCIGTQFDVNSKVYLDGALKATTFVSATDISFIMPLLAAPAARTAQVYVLDAGVLSSETLPFAIT